MPDRLKKRIALLMVTFLVLLSGIGFFDEFRFLGDISGKADQVVEQSISSPADQAIYLSDDLPGSLTLSGFMIVMEISPLPPLQLTSFLFCKESKRNSHPSTIKLFQLLSTYRI
ncbi:hypothetical protein [Candidatus Manganitrophus noduliformans]|uniref:Uncharacterized protein n=1 Tax=Candidatus Manganitrophus noduliformans TaxID=2606439 RepID=A0A7X6IDL1_9BACT|nr:hypothetical protein [Candidatus Manganitrophus noduliformans]NKE73524.1 hypothetical protein [Candidatus Manganitrophus noduliformans]